MSELEKFHEAVTKGNFCDAKSLLSNNMALINTANEEGLFPLHQACFRGHVDIVDFLLKNGADVNAADLKQGYTALMFAAITGNLDLVELLLERGARTEDTNRLRRTASQMAAFLGNHHVSTFINNFLERFEVDKFTLPSVPSSSRLDASASSSLYRLIIGLNITPVKVLMSLNSNEKQPLDSSATEHNSLLSQWRQAVNVLETLLEQYFTPHQTHEALALKFHVLACLLRRAGEFSDQGSDDRTTQGEKRSSPLSELIREFLTGAKPHGLPYGQEKFLRQALLSFPHTESNLWRQVVSQVAKVQPGYSPTALALLECSINGQGPFATPRGDSSIDRCATCGEYGQKIEIKLCHNCRETGYCSVACQRLHWFTHKKYCPILKAHHDSCAKSQKEAAASLASSG